MSTLLSTAHCRLDNTFETFCVYVWNVIRSTQEYPVLRVMLAQPHLKTATKWCFSSRSSYVDDYPNIYSWILLSPKYATLVMSMIIFNNWWVQSSFKINIAKNSCPILNVSKTGNTWAVWAQYSLNGRILFSFLSPVVVAISDQFLRRRFSDV